MKINLWTLNDSYQALVRLASQSLPKDQTSLAWKMKRIMAAAKREIEDLGDTLNDLMTKCGIVNGGVNDPVKLAEYNRQSKKFMKETSVELWGDPFKWSELKDHVSISPFDLADLDWLIIEDEAETEKTKTAGA